MKADLRKEFTKHCSDCSKNGPDSEYFCLKCELNWYKNKTSTLKSEHKREMREFKAKEITKRIAYKQEIETRIKKQQKEWYQSSIDKLKSKLSQMEKGIKDLLDFCKEVGDFSNGITCSGYDEGRVRASDYFIKVQSLLTKLKE